MIEGAWQFWKRPWALEVGRGLWERTKKRDGDPEKRQLQRKRWKREKKEKRKRQTQMDRDTQMQIETKAVHRHRGTQTLPEVSSC